MIRKHQSADARADCHDCTGKGNVADENTLDLRFFVPGPSFHSMAARRVYEDACAAELSRVFRAYYRVRSLIPTPLRRLLQKARRAEAAEGWYFPEMLSGPTLEAIKKDLSGISIVHPWPNGSRFALVLTHDVDTKEGFHNIPKLAAIEEELGFRSSWNLVPHRYPIDEGLIADLKSRSFEIGIHGYNHDGKLYWSRHEFDRRAVAINGALARYGAVGFRSPMVHRNLQWLQSLDIDYDSSCFDVDPFQAMPGGVGTIWPFVAGKFVELPYTLPQDHTLFVVLGERDGRIWREKRDFLARHQGMALMLTHPDYLDTPRRLDVYREFLTTTRDMGGYWHALPRELAQWWRQREQSVVAKGPEGRWTIQGPVSEQGRGATLTISDNDRLSIEEISHG